MRKGQCEIIRKAEKHGFHEAAVRALSDESRTLGELDAMYRFFLCHDGNAADAWDYDFFRKFHFELCRRYREEHGEVPWKYKEFYTFFSSARIQDVRRLHSLFVSGAYDAGEIFAVDELMSVPRGVDAVTVADAEFILGERKRATERGETVCGFEDAVNCIYHNGNLSGLTLGQKLELDCSAGLARILDGLGEKRASARTEVERFAVNGRLEKAFPGMYGLCFTRRKERDLEYDDGKKVRMSDDDVSIIDSIAGLVEKHPGSGIQVKVEGDCIREYEVISFATMSGISVSYSRCVSYTGYGFDRYGTPSVVRKYKKIFKILFLYDGGCLMERKTGNGWHPASLKNLYSVYGACPETREIVSCYMETLAVRGAYVWYDIKMLFENGGVVPPLRINDMKDFRSRDAMMKGCYKNAGTWNWNRMDLGMGYVIMKSMNHVLPRDRRRLLYPNEKTYECYRECCWEEPIRSVVASFLSNLIYSGLGRDGLREPDDDMEIVEDYVLMSFKTRNKVSLGMKSMKAVEREHDEIMGNYMLEGVELVKIPKHSVFRRLRGILPEDFEWIRTKRRLKAEGRNQHHCVASYAGRINADQCAIYSYVWEDGKRYTIQFGMDEGKYAVLQCRGVCNHAAPDGLLEYINSLIG